MNDKSDLIIDGYYFGSYEDAQNAEKEIKNATYLNDRISTMNVRQMKAVYDKMIDEKVFSTPVGWEFLKYLKTLLLEKGISEEEIRPIPLYVNFTSQKKDYFSADENSHIAKMRINPSRKKNKSIKDAFKISIIVNVFMVILVIILFYITINSDNPNIINYKQAITNEYADWEQELTQREQAVREKEKAFEDFSG